MLFFFVKKNLNLDICESKNECWFNDDFLSSNIPLSQSVSNQLVYRNSKLVNLPLNLVVEGDLILVRPGQLINLKCKPIKDNKVKDIIFQNSKLLFSKRTKAVKFLRLVKYTNRIQAG